MAREISTVDELIAALGGTEAAARTLGAREGTVTQWKHRGKLPSRRYWHQTQILRQRGLTASAALWGFDPAPTKATA